MKAYIDGRPDKDDPPEFEAPGNIVFLPVDKIERRAPAGGSPAPSTRRSSPARSPAASTTHRSDGRLA